MSLFIKLFISDIVEKLPQRRKYLKVYISDVTSVKSDQHFQKDHLDKPTTSLLLIETVLSMANIIPKFMT